MSCKYGMRFINPVFKIECRDVSKEFKVMLEIGKYGYEPIYLQIMIRKLESLTTNNSLSKPGEWFKDLLKNAELNYYCEKDNEHERISVSDEFSRLILQISVTYDEKYQLVHALIAQINGLQHKLTQALHFLKEENDTCLEAFCMTASHSYETFINEIKESLDPKQGTFSENFGNKHHWKPRNVEEWKDKKKKTYNLIERIESNGEEIFRLKFSTDTSFETVYGWLVEWCDAVSKTAPRKEDRSVWDELLRMGREEWTMIEHSIKEKFKNFENKIPFVKHVVNTAKEYFEKVKNQLKKESLSDFLGNWKKHISYKRIKTKTK